MGRQAPTGAPSRMTTVKAQNGEVRIASEICTHRKLLNGGKLSKLRTEMRELLWKYGIIVTVSMTRHTLEYTGVHWSTLEYTGVHWSTREYTGVHWMEYTGVHWSTREYTGVHWSTLEYIGVHWSTLEYTGVH